MSASAEAGARLGGVLAGLLWVLLCLRWFDDGEPFRTPLLAALPPAVLAVPALVAAAAWLRRHLALLAGPHRPGPRGGLLLVVGLAILFRLPLAVRGAEGYTTADGALSGLVALDLRDARAHRVFVPSVSYSGSLKSHLAAALSLGARMPLAFTLASLAFYGLFAAAVYRLGLSAGGGRAALGAGLWVAFSPTFVTQYSLSNDGNYVEVLALGSWALVLAARFAEDEAVRPAASLAAGILLGLAFWCHILAVIHAAAVALALVLAARSRSLPGLARLGSGFALGYAPGLVWNAAHGWASFEYLIPSGHWDAARYLRDAGAATEAAGPRLLERVLLLATDHAPVLFGYDSGYPAPLDLAVLGLASAGALTALVSALAAARGAWRAPAPGVNAILLVFCALNLAVALVALPHVPRNPRYLLFLFGPAAVLVAQALGSGRRRLLLVALVAFGALGSLGQAQPKIAQGEAWRGFVARLVAEGVRHCVSDYFLSTPITYLSERRVLCSSKLGPTTTEYFLDLREAVDRAPEAAIVAVNQHSADRIGQRLRELGVSFERLDLMKPVFLRLSRKVEPGEIFPGRSFAPRPR